MSEWEPAPRLRNALSVKATEITVEYDEWDDLRDAIVETSLISTAPRTSIEFVEPTDEEVVFADFSSPTRPNRFAQSRLAILTAAAAAAVLLAVISLLQAPEPVATANEIGNQCVPFPAQPTALVSEAAGVVRISSTARILDDNFLTWDPLVIDTTNSLKSPVIESTLVQASITDPGDLSALGVELRAARCGFLAGSAHYLVTDGTLASRGATCASQVGGSGLFAVVIVDPLATTSPCEAIPSTLIVTRDLDPTMVASWRDAHGCNSVDCDVALQIIGPTDQPVDSLVSDALRQFWNR